MEVLYENTYAFDERIAREHMRWSIFRSARMYMIIAMFVIITAMLLLVRRYAYAAVFGLVFCVWVIYTVISYYQGVRRMVKKYDELAMGEPHVIRFDFGDDCFISYSSAGGNILITYPEIKKVIPDKNNITLLKRDGSRLVMPRDCFVRGTADEFLMFIRGKLLKH